MGRSCQIRFSIFFLVVIVVIILIMARNNNFKIVYIDSRKDDFSVAYFYAPKTSVLVPLLVVLHTWSSDYKHTNYNYYLDWCKKHNWALIAPNYGGPAGTAQVTGSDMAVESILMSVRYAQQNTLIDQERIYLVGVSGGGYTALLTVSRSPHIWAAASVWCPISNLRKWHEQCRMKYPQYCADIEKACGGFWDSNEKVNQEYKKRSPISYLSPDLDVSIDINVGIQDGHTGSVPVSQSLEAFNTLARGSDYLKPEEIDYITTTAQIPDSLAGNFHYEDYAGKKVLFRRQSGKVRLTIFDGSHEIIEEAALRWISKQTR